MLWSQPMRRGEGDVKCMKPETSPKKILPVLSCVSSEFLIDDSLSQVPGQAGCLSCQELQQHAQLGTHDALLFLIRWEL